jgi:hypothetical protein
MSVNSQDTYVNILTPLSIIGSGGSVVSSFSTIFISSASVDYLNVVEINNFSLSSQIVEAEELYASTISTLALNLDNSLLTTVGTELLLNGVPLATTSNISSLSDWALDPAVSTLNMNGNSSINGSLTSTNVINAGSGLIGSLVCNDISTVTLTVQSTIHVVSTLSSLQIEAQSGIFSSINGIQFSQGISSFNTASVSSLTASSINGLSYPPPNSDVSQWANFPAVSTITGGAGATDDLKLSATRFLNANASGVNIVVDEGANVASLATFSVVAQNGNRGNISLTANPGIGGVFGQIGLTANGGSVLGVGAGGLIELTANTPLGTLCNATSAIKFSAAGINSYAGAVPSVGSLLGYNFIYGTLGVNLCAGLPPLLPNTAGTTYLYGTTGITLGSQTNTASDITQSSGAGLFTTLVTGYWPGGVFSPSNLVIRGRQIPVYGNSYVQLCNVDILSFDSGARKAITGVSTINGVAYPPPQDSIPSNLTVSSLTAANSVGTQALTVSSVNGSSYPPPVGGIPSDLVVSTLTASTSVTAPLISVSTLVNISTINGASYPPAASVPPSLVVSSLTAAVDVITFALSADTVLANVYVCTPQIVVSTLSARVANISTINVSSINGSKTSEPAVSTLAVNGSGFITLEDDPGTTASAPIFFKTGGETINEGILEIRKSGGYTDPSSRPYTGLAVEAFSTLGALQPIICGSLLINPTPNVAVGAPISGNSAGDIIFPMSSIVGVSTINGAPFNSFSTINVSSINGGVKQATYYTSTAQTLVSGNTDITFDSAGAWNNDGGYITHTAGTSSFTVVNAGLYQLEFNAVVLANGAIYVLTDQGKQVAIDVTRGTEQSVISNTALQASQQNYSMVVNGTYYLNASDVINLRIRNTFTGGPPTIQPVANTFDLNTFFTWTFIS